MKNNYKIKSISYKTKKEIQKDIKEIRFKIKNLIYKNSLNEDLINKYYKDIDLLINELNLK